MDNVPIAVEVRNLTKIYSPRSTKKALDQIEFSVPLGQTLCLLGPNGSGKTTLLKILAGLVKPTAGQISIMGMDSKKEGHKIQSDIGWMPADERSGFYGRITGHQNLKFFGTLQNIPEAEFNRQLGNLALQLGIKDELNHQSLRISSGFRQKMGLLRAMIHSPSILLLDEPFRNLDPHTLIRFRRLLKDHINRIQKKTVILSTHILEEARRVADFILFLHNGRVVQQMTARELHKRLKNQTVEDLYLKTIKIDDK